MLKPLLAAGMAAALFLVLDSRLRAIGSAVEENGRRQTEEWERLSRGEAALELAGEQLLRIETELREERERFSRFEAALEDGRQRMEASLAVRDAELLTAIARAAAAGGSGEVSPDPALDLHLLRLLDEGEAAYREGIYDRARDFYGRALELLPDYGPARAGFALAGYRANPLDSEFHATARRLLEGSTPVLRGDRDALEVLAEIALAREEWEVAADLYTELDERYSGYGEARELAARAGASSVPVVEAMPDE